MNATIVALLLTALVNSCSQCEVACWCDRHKQIARCQGWDADVKPGCGFKVREIEFVDCGSISPDYESTTSAAYLAETYSSTTSMTDESTSTTQESTSTIATISTTTKAIRKTRRMTKTTTVTTTTTTTLQTAPVRHATTTPPSLTYSRTYPLITTTPFAPTLLPTPDPTYPTPPPPEHHEPLEPPNKSPSQQQPSYPRPPASIADSLPEVWGPIAAVVGSGALGGAGYWAYRRHKRRRAAADLSRQVLGQHDGNNTNNTQHESDESSDEGANTTAGSAARGGGGGASPSTASATGSPNRPTGAADGNNSLNLSLNRAHTRAALDPCAAAIALNGQHHPSIQIANFPRTVAEYQARRLDDPMFVALTEEQKEASERARQAKQQERRRKREEERRRRQQEADRAQLGLDPQHLIALMPIGVTAAQARAAAAAVSEGERQSNSSVSTVNETSEHEDEDRRRTDESFLSADDGADGHVANRTSTPRTSSGSLPNIPAAVAAGEKKKRGKKKQTLDEAGSSQAENVGNQRQKRSANATKRPERLGEAPVVLIEGSKYNIEHVNPK